MKQYFSYWNSLSGDAQTTAGTVILGPLTDALSANDESCSISLDGDSVPTLSSIDKTGNLTQLITYTLTLDGIDDLVEDVNNDQVVVRLSQVPACTILYPSCGAPPVPITVPVSQEITISGAANFIDIAQAKNIITFEVTERIVDLDVEVELDYANPPPNNVVLTNFLQGDLHYIDLSNALSGIENELATYVNKGGAFNDYFASTTAINIKVVGINNGAVIKIPVIGNKIVDASAEVVITGEKLKQIYNAWKLIETNTDLTYTEKTENLLNLAMVPIHGAMYSDQSFSTQVNYIDSSGVNHADEQVIVTVSPIATVDSYAIYDAGFIYTLVDDNKPEDGFTDNIILRIKISDLQLRDIYSSEEHTLTIELGSNFDNLKFELSGSSLWHKETTATGKSVLVFGPTENITQALLDNPEIMQIDIAFDKGKLLNKFDTDNLNGILEDHVIFKIYNNEIAVNQQDSSITNGNIDYGNHTMIVENQGHFLYFNIADTLDNLALNIVTLSDQDNNRSYPTVDQITKYFDNYFYSTDIAATIKTISGLQTYNEAHTYTVTAPDGSKIDLTSVTGGYSFSITAEQLENIMLNYDPNEPSKNIFYLTEGDFNPDETFAADVSIAVADVPYEIDLNTMFF